MSEHVSVTQLRHATQQTQEWLKELKETQPFETEEQAYSFLRAVLHAVRDRLTVEEAVHLGQQLPMLVRGFYFEGWKPAIAPNDFDTQEEFFSRVEESIRNLPQQEEEGISVAEGARGVLAFLEKNLDEGTLRHVKQQLPSQLERLFPAPLAGSSAS